MCKGKEVALEGREQAALLFAIQKHFSVLIGLLLKSSSNYDLTTRILQKGTV